MVNYRRDKIPGGTYFFTLTLKDRKSTLLTQYIAYLRHSFQKAKKNHEFIVKAIVVLPEHLHLIMELPEGEEDYSTRLRQIKTYFVQDLLSAKVGLLKNKRNEYNLW